MSLLQSNRMRRAADKLSSRYEEESPSTLTKPISLDAFLDQTANGSNEMRAMASLLRMIAKAGIHIAEMISLGHVAGAMGASVDTENREGDVQKQLDIVSNEVFINALRGAPVAAVLSEELSSPLLLNPAGCLVVAIDPLDGSSNIDANISIGTIFAVFPALADALQPADHFLRPGHEQVAAGFIIYGPQTSLVFTLGDGVHVFTLNRKASSFLLAIPKLAIPDDSTEYAINASNYRHWDHSVRTYIDDCISGADGPLSQDHNMRWIASLVADAYRILVRGGVFLYPADERSAYANGRLRLIYEANPISFLVEQAGGGATDTVLRILEIQPNGLHTRTPFVFGSRAAIERISRYHADQKASSDRSPLFFQRGLIRR